MFDNYYRVKVFCICHQDDVQYYKKLEKHLQANSGHSFVFSVDSNLTIKAGENRFISIINEIRNSDYIVYLVSSDSQADHKDLFRERSNEVYCRYYAVEIRPIQVSPISRHAEHFSNKELNEYPDQDEFWKLFVQELKFRTVQSQGLRRFDENEFAEAQQIFEQSRKYIPDFANTRIGKIKETNIYVRACEDEILIAETRARCYDELKHEIETSNGESKTLKWQLARIRENLKNSDESKVKYRKGTFGLALGVLILLIISVRLCNRVREQKIVLNDQSASRSSPIYLPELFVKDSFHISGKVKFYKKDDIYLSETGSLYLNAKMLVKTKHEQSHVFYWRLLNEKNEIIMDDDSPNRFTRVRQLDISPNLNVYDIMFMKDNIQSTLPTGYYRSELWLDDNGSFILLGVDHFRVKK